MTSIIRDKVLEQLAKVKGPDLEGNIVDLGLVENVLVNEGKAIFSIKVPSERAQELEPLRQAAEKAVSSVEGINSVTAVLTAERKSGSQTTARPASSASQTTGAAQPAQGQSGRGGNPQSASKVGVPGIKSIIAVASGKGGVGKSTTSVNLALGLAATGLSVGILDADIYGPSMPRMLGITGRPSSQGKVLTPHKGFGLKVMSMGFLVEEETPMIWRGPMVISALTQMLREIAWGDLDILVVDMPPGTGDAQLTMAQQVPLAGAVIVSTPQDIALIDARKGLNMFRKVEVPILGLIENMSFFVCPSCGERSDIFGHGGAREEAERLDTPFLGEVPLHMDIRKNSDGGTPIVVSSPDSEHAKIYKAIAAEVISRLQLEQSFSAASGPEIVFE
ncbi:MAG: iron-sulfur cluster carrier protein ApbC [Pseudomonadota bacterium]